MNDLFSQLRMTLFYATEESQNLLRFSPEEGQHALKTLRHREGDIILVTNGKGYLWEARILSGKTNDFSAEIIKTIRQDLQSPSLHIYMALPKNPERFEWFLEKTTEIGIGSITPLVSQRSEKFFAKHERWQKILVAAMKQSGRLHVPILHQEKKFKDCLNDPNPIKLIAHCIDQVERFPLAQMENTGRATSIYIGPEGDFTEDEVKIALQHNFQSISLGNSRLRTETAGVVACTLWNFI